MLRLILVAIAIVAGTASAHAPETRWEYATLFFTENYGTWYSPDGDVRQAAATTFPARLAEIYGRPGATSSGLLAATFAIVGHARWELIVVDQGMYVFKRPMLDP